MPHLSPDPSTADNRPPLCAAAPLLWSLIPLAGGILVERSGSFLFALFALVACLALRRLPGLPSSRWAVFVLSALAGFLLHALHYPEPDPSWGKRPPRETRAILQVEETFNARKAGRISGIGKILQTRLPVDTVTGSRAAFYLESAEPSKATAGTILECRGALTYLLALEEPDDYQMYLQNRDIHLSLNQGRVLRKISPAPPVEQFRQRLFKSSEDLLTSGCTGSTDPGYVLASMLLGNRSLLSDSRIDIYRRTGTYHLFAVSGLHVGSVALLFFLITRFLPMPVLVRLLPVISGTWGYVWLTGSSPSAVRAGIMITCLSLSRVLLRQPHLFPALVLSAWLVLLWNPGQLFQLGFQLSYGVVLSIILAGLPLAQHLRQIINDREKQIPHPGRLRGRIVKCLISLSDIACVSISAGLASMPLIVQHFGLFTPGGVLFGILLNPLATLSVMAGCLTLLAGPLAGTTLAGTIALLVWPAIRLIEWILQVCLRIPGAVDDRTWAWEPTGTLLTVAMLILAWVLQRFRMRGLVLHWATYLLPHLLVLTVLGFGSINT